MNSNRRICFYLSIVSHGHLNYIKSNIELQKIAQQHDVFVIIKDNLVQEELKLFCHESKFIYLTSDSALGFGSNNNFVFNYCKSELGMEKSDYFLVVNPDVDISLEMFNDMKILLTENQLDLFTVNLFKDVFFTIPENSLRAFPTWRSVVKAFAKQPICTPVDKNAVSNFSKVDWASGAFLGFSVELYNKLNGFDENYFMYYEDVDICYRSNKIFGFAVVFLKNIKAVHVGAYQNRNIFSKHFRWYISSLFRFLNGAKRFGN